MEQRYFTSGTVYSLLLTYPTIFLLYSVPDIYLFSNFFCFFVFSTVPEKPKKCPGLGLFYAVLSTVFLSIISLLVKTIQGVHAIEISAIRCFFQMLFIAPLLIYHK